MSPSQTPHPAREGCGGARRTTRALRAARLSERRTAPVSSRCKNNYFAETWSGFEGSYLRLIDVFGERERFGPLERQARV